MTKMASEPLSEAVPPTPSAPHLGTGGDGVRDHWPQGEEVLDGYKVEGELGAGEGGMGRVYLLSVKAPELRRYAVKHLTISTASDRRLFLGELQTWIDLPEHPHLVTFRFPRLESDDLYLFADYIEGGSLLKWMDGRKKIWDTRGESTPLESLLDIAIQLAWGLHALHAWHVIHADLKPENAFRTEHGLVKVGDFGITLAIAALGDSGAAPKGYDRRYCSPEQHQFETLTFQTDLWSWGATVLQLFTGSDTMKAPQSGPEVGANLEAYLSRRRTAQPWLPPMPSAVVEVLRKCFETEPAERGSALEIANDLRKIYDYRRPEPAFPDAAERPLESHDRRSRYGVQWGDARELLTSLVGAEPAQALLLPREGLGRRAQAVADLAAYEDARRLMERMKAEPELDTRARQDLERRFAGVLTEKALIHEQLDDTPGELAQYQRAVDILEPLATKRPELANDLAAAYMNMGNALTNQGKLAEAIGAHGAAIAIYEPLAKTRPELANGLAATYMNMGNALTNQGNLAEAIGACDAAIAIYEPLAKMRPELANDLARAYMNKGVALTNQGKPAEAIGAYDATIAIYEPLAKTRPELANDLAMAYVNKGNALQNQGKLAEAIGAYDAAIAIHEPLAKTRPELANDLARAYVNKGVALTNQGKLAEAIGAYDAAIAIYEPLAKTRPELANDLARTYVNKGVALQNQGKPAEAIGAYDAAIAIREPLAKTRPELSHDLAMAYVNKGNALQNQGKSAEAIGAYDAAIAIYEPLAKTRPELANDLARIYMNQVIALQHIGELDKALAALGRALEINPNNA